MIKIERLSKDEWSAFSEDAHKICFSENKPWDWDRIDFALLAVDNTTNVPLGYMTVRELDHETVYWQYGGAFPGCKGTAKSMQAYEALTDYFRIRYRRVSTLIENTNFPMLRMANRVGFVITGLRLFNGHILLENVLEFKGEDNGDSKKLPSNA